MIVTPRIVGQRSGCLMARFPDQSATFYDEVVVHICLSYDLFRPGENAAPDKNKAKGRNKRESGNMDQ